MRPNAAVLVTGMSGVGKSTALAGLAQRGYATVDTDDGPWIDVIDGEPLWRESLIAELLAQHRDGPLFVQGTVANQWRFYDRFDAVVLLTAPTDVVLNRVQRRTNNPFGKTAAERARILADIAEIEPLLRRSATHEIDTTRPLPDVIDALATIAETAAPDRTTVTRDVPPPASAGSGS
ncbi:AAA family ATPase [Mycolicibacterium sp. lyk4-40-TYG-92]|uniref:AAA family ATPase n=1 Tax=Mycolicibacterium sp. lyk4-40-TYG-92 TaxID=3040295 RepID=UPI002549E324|nr:AAA family ATPase [Mycolicibacterium sp. lyk4-40-TYG-92]